MRNFPNRKWAKSHRYWWFDLKQTGYLPNCISELTRLEKRALKQWYSWTDKTNSGIGESNIPIISLLMSFINGNGITRIVQLGHYTGYSSLFIASTLKKMGKGLLYSIDIDPWATDEANKLVRSARVDGFVKHVLGDSASASDAKIALDFIGEMELLYIDSDHTYKHAKAELNVWWPLLKPGGFVFMHDSSIFATSFGNSPDQGVKVAAEEFFGLNEISFINLNGNVGPNENPDRLVYLDSCGLIIAQKPL
jgi:predicted O-methyltransferase YrrM